ncbi:MAG: carbohydrate ABC transporter permease [Pseudanabaenaceae cyanobacterium]
MKTDPWARWLDDPQKAGWTFLAPALLVLGIFAFLPMLYLVYLSLTTGHFTIRGVRWVGLSHYLRLFRDPDFFQVCQNTAVFTFWVVIPSVVIPLGLAVLLDRALVGRGILRSLYFLPAVVSIVAAGLGWRWLFQADGIVNQLGLKPPIPWLNEPFWAMVILILLSIWKQIGFNMVVFLAGLQAIPQSLYEAAELDGANAWQKFRYITLPSLRGTLLFVTIATIIFTFRSFEQVYVVTGGGPLNATNILVYFVYEQAFGLFDFGYGAAAAIVLLGVVLGIVYIQLRTVEHEQSFSLFSLDGRGTGGNS